MLCLIPIKGTIKGEDILKNIFQCTNTIVVDLTKLISLASDRDIAMIGINKGNVASLRKACYEY